MGARARRVEPWPVALAGALAFMIATSLSFLFVSLRHPDPVVAADTYAAEPLLAHDLRARERAVALGFALEVATRAVAGGVEVDAALLDATGGAVVADRVLARRERPAEGGLDAEVALVRAGDRYRGVVPLPRSGRWRLSVRAEREGVVVERSLALRGPG